MGGFVCGGGVVGGGLQVSSLSTKPLRPCQVPNQACLHPFLLTPRLCSFSKPFKAKSSSELVIFKFRTSPMAMAVSASSSELDVAAPGSGVNAQDLLIVGPGVLGRLIAQSWVQSHPSAVVYGQTRSTDHHEELMKMGIIPIVKGSTSRKFPFVVFCAPPSGNQDYPAEVREATSLWNRDGSFLFTSSSAVYDCNNNGLCTEDNPTVPLGSSSRTDILIRSEEAVLSIGGNVVRLAGLYTADRGAHMYCLKIGTSDSRPDYILNLIHYQDAALLCKLILEKKFQGQVFMGCDGHPLTRQEMMDEVVKCGKFERRFKGFTGFSGPLGKKMDNSRTRELVGWEPDVKSFAEFLSSL